MSQLVDFARKSTGSNTRSPKRVRGLFEKYSLGSPEEEMAATWENPAGPKVPGRFLGGMSDAKNWRINVFDFGYLKTGQSSMGGALVYALPLGGASGRFG